MLIRGCVLLCLFVLLPNTVTAAEDFRLRVEIVNHETLGNRPDLVAAMRQAIPLLWDRLIPRSQRAMAENLTGSLNMVSRIVPGEKMTMVEFDHQAVFAYLSRSHISYLATAPGFRLDIQMQNSVGLPMLQSKNLIEQYARHLTSHWGIDSSVMAPSLILDWQWLDATHVRLDASGDSRLQPFNEVRDTGNSDALVFLQAWLEETLLRARDAYAFAPGAVAGIPQQGGENLTAWLFVDRSLSLGEQVVLEDALQSDPRILQLIPYSYSNQGLRYRIMLKGLDSNWFSDWFTHRDFVVEAVAGGWKVR